MELFSIGLAVVVLVVFDLVALRFGVDSRDRIGDDRIRPLNPRWT
jgi:hypothetical protein